MDGTTHVSHALRQAERRLRLALEAGHMCAWEYDALRDQLHWSDGLASLTGAPGRVVNGSLAEGLTHVHPDDRGTLERAFKETLEFLPWQHILIFEKPAEEKGAEPKEKSG